MCCPSSPTVLQSVPPWRYRQRRYDENPLSCVNEVDEPQRNRTDSEADAFPTIGSLPSSRRVLIDARFVMADAVGIHRSNASHQRGRAEHLKYDEKLASRPPLHALVGPRRPTDHHSLWNASEARRLPATKSAFQLARERKHNILTPWA